MTISRLKKKIIVAIDGPAGSGKSTTAKALARKLGLPYIDTGAMYRAITHLAIQKSIPWSNEAELVQVAKKARIDLKSSKNGTYQVIANGEDVSHAIRTPELTNQVHHVASCPGVRAQMVKLQRGFGKRRGGVLEGRDIGTVVFPATPYKFYLDADFDLRVRRRHRELAKKGIKASLAEVKRDLKARDQKDFGRKVGGLKVAEDATVIDTTGLTIERTADIIARFILAKQKPVRKALRSR